MRRKAWEVAMRKSVILGGLLILAQSQLAVRSAGFEADGAALDATGSVEQIAPVGASVNQFDVDFGAGIQALDASGIKGLSLKDTPPNLSLKSTQSAGAMALPRIAQDAPEPAAVAPVSVEEAQARADSVGARVSATSVQAIRGKTDGGNGLRDASKAPEAPLNTLFDGLPDIDARQAGVAIVNAGRLLNSKHIDTPDSAKLYRLALSAIHQAIGVPDERRQADLKVLNDALDRNQNAIGISWVKQEGMAPRVESVVPGSSAEVARILVGDSIAKINGQSTMGMSGEEFSRLMNQKVSLVILNGNAQPRAVSLKLTPLYHVLNSEDSRVAAVFQAVIKRAGTSSPARLAAEAALAMAGSLDRNTHYLPPAMAKAMDEHWRNSRIGLGMVFSDAKGASLHGVVPGSPAHQAGLRAGDRLISIDGQPLTGLNTHQIVQAMRLEEGVSVSVVFQRDGAAHEVKITPRPYSTPEVFFMLLPDGAGYVHLASFSRGAAASVGAAVKRLRELGAKSIILDLRGNGGGLSDEAQGVASLFIREGMLFKSLQRGGLEKIYSATRRDSNLLADGIPLAVLIDRHSASASEVVSMALRDYKRAKLVGERSYGKGTGGLYFDLRPLGVFYIITQRWFGPSGENIEGRGLEPDVHVSVSDQERAAVYKLLSNGLFDGPLADTSNDAALVAAQALLKQSR